MDRLAACHAMYGFLQLPGHGRGRHPSAPNCQNVKRSLSLTDRRGLISPGRASGRGLISPMPNRMLARGTADEWEGMARKLHGTDSISRLHDFGFLMHALGRSGQMLLPAASAMEFGRGIGRNRSFTFGRRRRELDIWRGEQLGQLLVSLRYTVANSQLWVEVHRAGGVRATTPYVTVWLFRGTDKPEKRSTKPVGDSRRFSIAPVFDESFLFDVSPSEVRDLTLAVSVMNSGSGGDPDTEIGYCVIGELGPEEVGKWHWRETMGHQGTTVTQWHGLMADC